MGTPSPSRVGRALLSALRRRLQPLGGLLGLSHLDVVHPLSQRNCICLFGPVEFLLLTYPGLGGYCGFFPWQAASRGLIAGGFGLMLAFVGVDTVSGQTTVYPGH